MVNRAKLERLIFIREIQASFIGVGLLLVVLLLLAIALTPRSITVRLSAAQFEQGSRRVVIHALDNVDLTKTLLTEETDATVSDGHLQIQWMIPQELRDRPFIIEVCTTKNGAKGTEVCAKPEVGQQESQQLAVKGVATDGALYSCPYYVSGPKTSFVASLLGMNDVELDSRVYCGTSNGISDEFSSESRAAQIGRLSINGIIPSGSGILTVKDGQLSLIDPASLNLSTAATSQATIVQQYYPTALFQQIASSDPAQTLVLTNRTLSISNGNSVLIPETVIPTAGSLADGLLSSADWNAFSSKENSLTFDSSLTRTGDTIGLMSCAVGEILKNDGSTWVCANDIGASSGAYTASTGIAIDFANNIYNTGVLSVSASGALTATTGQSPAIALQTTSSFSQLAGQLSLSATGVISGNYNNVTVNTEGRVTSATNVAYLTTEQDGIIGNEVSDVIAGGGLVLSGGGTSASPYKIGLITTCVNGQILKWNGSSWACAADNNTTNTDNQTLSYNPTANILTIAGGNTVDLSALKDNTDNQSIVRTGNTISISGSTGTVDLTPYLDNTDSQTLAVSGTGTSRTMTISGGNTVGIGDSDNQALSIAGNVISLTNGGSVTLPADQNTTYSNGNGMSLTGTVFAVNAPTCTGTTAKLLWSGTAFTCGTDIDTDTNTTYSAGSGLTLSGTTFALAQQGASSGQVLKWNGIAWAPASDVDTDMQSIAYDTSTRVVNLTNGGSFTIPLAAGSTTGLLSAADWANFNNKENVLTFGDGLLRTSNTVGLMDCAAGQILQRNGTDTAWLCANQVVDTDTNTTYSAGTGISINGSNQISATLGTTIDGTEIIDGTITVADLATIAGLTPGTYNNVTVNAQGQVVGGTNVNYLTSYTETDGTIGNEVAGVVASGGLVMTGSGTSVSPYKLGLVTTCSDGQLLKYTTAGGWACANDVDTDTNTDAQSLSWNATNNVLSISGGNTVDLSSLKDNTDLQTLAWNAGARTISISSGNTITLPADQNTTYSSGDGISLTGTVFAINAPTCSLSQKLIWTGTTFSCENDIDTDTDTNTTYGAGDGLTLSGTTFALDRQGASTGQVLAWDGTKWAPYSPSAFSDTDDQTLSYNSTTRELSIDGGNTVTFPLASSTASGLLSASDWSTFNGKENILTFSDGIMRSSNVVTLMDCAANQVLQRNSTDTAWLCANQVVDTDTNTTYTAGTGLSLSGSEFSSTGILSVTSSGALTTTTGQNPAITLMTTSDFSQVANQLALSTTGVTAGIYNGMTVDSQGRVTNATQMNYLTSENDGAVGNEVAGVITGGGLVMTGAGTSGDPYKVGMISTCNSGELLKWVGGQWVCASDTDTNTDTQALTFNSMTGDLSLTNGGTVNLNSLNTDNQSLSLAGNILALTSGGSVDLTPYLDNTDNQSLSMSGNTITLTNGGSITLPADQNTTYSAGSGLSENASVFAISAPTCSATTQKLIWDGSAFVCATDKDTDTNTDAQTLSWDNGTRTLTISGGNNVVIPSDNTDTQDISYDSVTRTVSLTDGGSFVVPLSSGTTSGLLSAADWAAFSGKENVLTFGDGLLRNSNTVTLMDCAANQLLQRNGADSAWVCANQVVDTDTNTTYSAGTGITIDGSNQIASTLGTSIEGFEITDGTITSADLATIAGLTAGTYNNVTVNAQGQVTNGTNVAYLTAESDAVVGNEVANVTNNGGLVMTGSGTAGDPYKVGLVTTCSNSQLLKYTTAGGWACANDIDTNTDAQTLSWNTGSNILTVSGGNTVDLTSLKDNTDNQTLSIAGNIISLTNGGSVVLPADQNTTYTAGSGISLTSTVFAINAPTCTGATTKLLWSGTAFMCGTDVDTDTNTTYDAGSGLSLAGTTFALAQQGASTGQVLAWNGSAWAPLTPSVFSDTDDQTLSYNASTRELSIDGGNTITFPLASATGSGLLSSADWTTFNGKENILTFSDGLLRSSNTVTLMDCAADQILQRNSGDTAWVCANQVVDTDTNTTYMAGTGLSLTGNTFANTGTLSVSASGALTSSGGQNPAITLATTSDLTQVGGQLGLSTTGVSAGTYNNVTVDAQGRVTTGTNLSYLTSEQDAVIGNEVAGVVANGGLVMTGAGTALSPYKVGLVTTCSDGQLLKYTAAGGWACATDIDTNTDAQTLSYNAATNILTLANGGTVDLSDLQDNTDSQTLTVTSPSAGSHTIAISGGNSQSLVETQDLSWNSTTRALSITGGTTVTIADANTTYSAGAGLDLTGTTFSLAQQGASSGQVLKWNGTAWAPAADIDTDTNTTYSAGSGLALTGTTFSLGSCSAGQIYKYNGTAWACSADVDTNTDAQTLSYNTSTRELSISGGNIISFPLASATGSGLLSSTDWSTFNSKENVLAFSDGLARTGNNVTLMDCAASQILQRNAGDTAWVCASQVTDTNTTYTAGTGLSLTGTTFANTGVLSVTASGALTSSGGQNPAITLTTTSDLTQLSNQLGLSNTGVTAGTYNNVTVDAKGRVTAATNVSYLTNEQDAVIGNEVAGVVTNGGLVMTGSGTALSPYKVGLVTTCSDGQLLKYTALGGWACANDVDTDTNTDAQTLSWNGTTNILTISGGNTVDLTSLKDNTDNQTLGIAGNVISLTNGGSVTLPADQNTTYTSGNGLSLTGTVFAINAPTCAGTTKLQWNGSAFICASDVDTDAQTLTVTGTGASRTLSISNGNTVAIPDTDTTYAAGTGVTITSNTIAATLGTDITSSEIVDGTITAADIAASGATAGTYGDSGVNVAQVTVNAAGQITTISNRALPTANVTTTGVLTSTDWATFNGKENVLTFTGNGLFSRSGNTITGATCTGTQILKWNGTAFACAADLDTNTTYTSSNGITLTGTNFTLTNDFGASIDSSEITDGAIANVDLAANSVTSANIVDGTIASADIASGAVTNAKIAACSTNGQILKYYATDPDGVGPLVAGWNCDADSNTDAVSSVFGRTGAVTAQNGDYTASQITNTPAGNIAAATVQAALNELDTEKLGVTLNNGQIWVGNGSNVATAVTPNGDVAISNTGVTTIQANSVALGTDTTGNYAAGATAGNGITVSGTAGEGWSPTIAINAPTCTAGQYTTWNGTAFSCGTPTDTTNFNVSANGAGSQNVASGNTVNFQNGTGTTATVDASKNVSFNLTNVGTAGTYGSATTVPVITTDAQGRITGVTNTAISFPAEVDGVIGNEVTNATTNGGLIRAGSGTAGSPYTLGLITTCTDQQVLKYTVGTTSWGCAADNDTTYSAGTGITITSGVIAAALGTDITSSEIVDGTIAAADLAASGATAGTYGDSGVNVAQLTVNAQGQVTAVSNRALPTASATTTGILTSTDWSTFNGKENVLTFTGNGLYSRVGNTVTGLACTTTGQTPTWNGTTFACGTQIISLNGLNGALTLQTGTAGADFNISASGNTITLNIPDASATARGLVTTGTQTFAGDKTLTGSTTLGDANTDVATVNGTLLNNGATSYGVLSIANVAAGGAIGTAATTVDIKTAFNINQTTAGQAITLPTPTDTAAGRIAYVQNIGSASFSFYGTSVLPNQSRQAIWNGTAWVLTGNADDPKGSIVLRKSADEAVNNSIAPQNDDHLFWTVGANETWIFEVSGTVRSGATANLRLRMALPGTPTSCSNSASASYNGSARSNAACNTDIILTNINNQAATDNSDQFTYYGTFKTGASGGTAQMMFAQGTATNILNVTGVNMTAGGSGYTSAPTVGFTGGTCSVAPVGTATIYNGQVVSVNVTTAGTCTAAPTTVTFTGGGGTGATASIVRGITLARDTTLNAFRVSGADVAEFYYSKDATVVPADIVALDGSGPSQVMKASLASRDKTVGIVSTKPGQVLGEIDGTGKPVIIGLAGRVPVKVKGKVVAGDMITVSDEPGVGMAAKTSGRVVGKALTGFAGDGVGQVMMLIDNTYWQAPVNFDLSSIISTGGVNVITVPQTTDSQLADIGIKPVDTTSYSGFDQAIVDQIMNAFKTQQSQIDELKAAVSALKQPVGTTQGATLQAAVWSGGIVTNDTTFNGLVTFNSHVIFSGDNAGSVTIPAGQTTASIILKSSMTKAPKVVATPGGFTVGQYRVTGQTTSGFIIELQQPQTTDMTFDWHAFESTNP